MNIFVAGATGVLGRRLVRQFSERGHQVTGLVRSRAGERLVESLGGTPRFADLFDSAALVHAAEGAEVVIHAATAIPLKARTRASDWEANDRIRGEGTEALVDCAGRVGAKQFIFQSIVWVARHDGTSITELEEVQDELNSGDPPHIDMMSSFGEDAAGELYICEVSGTGGEVFRIVPGPGCVGDCGTIDDVVSTADLLALLAQWGGTGTCDLDGGGVTTADLLIMLANWGSCP